MNVTFTSWKRALWACAWCHFGLLATLAADVNYQSVKSEIEIYAKADDLMDERLLLARSKIRGLPATAAPHLMRLFTENEQDGYREAIVDALEHNQASYDISVPFILKQLQGSPNEWKGKIWITRSMDFLLKADKKSAASIAKKAAESKDDFIRSKAWKLLAEMDSENREQENDAAVSIQSLPSPLKPASRTAPEARPAPAVIEEPTSLTPWSIIVMLIVAGCGLLWLLLKRRS